MLPHFSSTKMRTWLPRRLGPPTGQVVCSVFGVLLSLTASTKLYGLILGPEQALRQEDWLLQIEMRWLLTLAALLEAGIAVILLSPAKPPLKYVSGFAFFTWLALYRIFPALLGGPDPNGCGCLGYITDSVDLPPELVETWLLGFLVLGWFSFTVTLVRTFLSTPPTLSTGNA